MVHLKKTTLHIKGMHCPSCDILIEDKFNEVVNVKKVKADYKKCEAEIYYHSTLDRSVLNKKIAPFGYMIGEGKEEEVAEPYIKRLLNAGAVAVILFILLFFAQELQLVPEFNTSSGLTLGTVSLLGLVASTSTCMATSGALFLATVGKLRNDGANWMHNLIPAISFNLGRIITYGVFGLITGYVGKIISADANFGSGLTLFVAIMMILVGLNMLKLLPFSSSFTSSLTKGIFQKLEHKLIRHPKKTSFFLGAITYLLPCGFTQTVQLYALGLADPAKSALIMVVFAVGTMPALLAMGFASSFTKTSFYPVFNRVVGVLVFIIGIVYFGNYLTLKGIQISLLPNNAVGGSEAVVKNGYQVVNMSVDGNGYSPNSFTIRKGVPVKWVINGENVFGCQGYLVAPKLGIQKLLEKGDNIIEFTPEEEGPILFSCAMGMYRGRFNVI